MARDVCAAPRHLLREALYCVCVSLVIMLNTVADPEISKRGGGGGTDRTLYTPLTAHARKKLYAQCD